LLVSAKLPLIKNAHRYLNEVLGQYNLNNNPGTSSKLKRATDFIFGWNSMVSGIETSIRGIENAIDHARMEKVLYELEELRAEQEAETEISRAQEHLEWQSKPDKDETLKLNSNGVMLALLGLILTFVIYPKEIILFLTGKVYTHLTDIPYISEWSQRVLIIFIVPFVLYIFIEIFGYFLKKNPFTKKFKKRLETEMITKYQFEIDARIDFELSHSAVNRLHECDFKFPDGKEYIDDPNLTLYKPTHKAYRVERLSDNEALHKFHFTATALWDAEQSGMKNSELQCHIIYEVLSHKIADKDSYILREMRLISHNKGILTAANQKKLKKFVIQYMVNCWLDGDKKLLEDDAIFSTQRVI